MKGFLIILFSLYFAAFYGKGQDQLPKEITEYKYLYFTAKSDTEKVKWLGSLIEKYYDLSDFNNTLLYNYQLRLFSEKLKSSSEKTLKKAGIRATGMYYVTLGDVFQKQSKYQQANDFYFRSLELFKQIGDLEQVGVLYSNIAGTFSSIGNYKESLEYCYKALGIHEKLGNKMRIAIELNNIGSIYSDINNYSKSFLYHSRAKKISEEIHDEKLTGITTGNIGHYFKALCDSAFVAGNKTLSFQYQDSAFHYFKMAAEVSAKISDIDNIAVCLENIGIMYSNIDNFNEALPYLTRALDYYKQLGLNAEQSFCLGLIGQAYYGVSKIKEAELSYRESLRIAEETKSNYFLMHACLGNSEFFEKTNRPVEALSFYKRYIEFKDSLFSKENMMAITRTEMNHEFNKKVAETKFQNDRIVYELSVENKLAKQWRLFFIVVFLMACIGLFFVRRAYVNKKELAAFLSAEDQRKDVLLQEVHHRINNNLQIISSLLTLQANSADDEKLKEYLSQSQNRIQSLSALHELLYDTNTPLEINMKDYLEKVLDFHRDIFKTKNENILIVAEIEPVGFPTKTAVPVALIVNELVTNSIKYAFNNSHHGKVNVVLKACKMQHQWQLMVSDNGVGLPITQERREGSLGLKLVQIMTKQIKGVLSTSNDDGAVFNIIFSVLNSKK